MIRRLAPLLLLATATGCSSHGDQPGGVTADEAHQLNEAAAMLDANSMTANAATTETNESGTQ